MHFYIVNACTPHIFILVFLILFEDKYKFNFSGIVWVLLLMLICNITVMYQGREFLRVRALVEWFLPWEKFEYKLKIIWKTCWEIERENKGAEKVNSNGCAVMKRTRAKLVEMSMGSRKREKREIFYVAKEKKSNAVPEPAGQLERILAVSGTWGKPVSSVPWQKLTGRGWNYS